MFYKNINSKIQSVNFLPYKSVRLDIDLHRAIKPFIIGQGFD